MFARAEAKLGVTLCHWVNPSGLTTWSLPLPTRAVLSPRAIPALLGLGWTLFQRNPSNVSIFLQFVSPLPHHGCQLLPSPTPFPIAVLCQSRNEGNRNPPLLRGLPKSCRHLLPSACQVPCSQISFPSCTESSHS